LLSLLEPKQENNGRSIDPVFEYTPDRYWSADICVEKKAAWIVRFDQGTVACDPIDKRRFVRLVRTWKDLEHLQPVVRPL